MTFSASEKETICSLDLKDNIDALNLQKSCAHELSLLYETGGDSVPRDKWKAAKFREQAGELAFDPGSPVFRTKTAYFIFRYYTFARLYLLRLDFLSSYFFRSFLPRLFSIAGLSYGAELLFDIGVILYSTFHHDDDHKTIGQRFLDVLLKDNRPSRMANAAIWFALNLTCFIITGGLSTLLTVCGFGFDICHEFTRSMIAYRHDKKFLDKVSQEIELKNDTLHQSQGSSDPKLNDKVTEEKLNQCDVLKREIKALQCIETKLTKKIKTENPRRAFNFFSTSVVLVGFALCFYPPTILPGIILTCIGLALDTEGLFHEYLKKPFQKAKQFLSSFGRSACDRVATALYHPALELQSIPAPQRDSTKFNQCLSHFYSSPKLEEKVEKNLSHIAEKVSQEGFTSRQDKKLVDTQDQAQIEVPQTFVDRRTAI